jgi:hypothetical protein
MALTKDPLSAAGRVQSEAGAARLYWKLETELLSGEGDSEWRGEAEQARDDLAAEFGGANHLRTLGGQGAPGGQHGGGRRAGSRPSPPKRSSTKPAAPAGSRRAPGSRKPAPRTTRPSSSRRAARGAGRRAFEQTGLPGAGRSAAAFGLEVLGLMIAMALLYLLLTDAERARRGAGVIGQVLGVVTGSVHAFISPADPLAPRAAAGRRSADPPAGPGAGALGAPDLGGFPRAKTYTNRDRVTTP